MLIEYRTLLTSICNKVSKVKNVPQKTLITTTLRKGSNDNLSGYVEDYSPTLDSSMTKSIYKLVKIILIATK